MPSYVLTPWRERSELLTVRRQLYQLAGPKEEDGRQHAVNVVGAWKSRGNLPHAVESTALLVDAFLHHDVSKNSIFSIRAVYSAAFCRFVTGFCDIGRNKSNRVEKSMYEIARELDMPASFVELRHEATHDELPTLQRLQRNSEDALKWLWQYYWAKIDLPLPVLSAASVCEANTIDSNALVHELQTLLKDFLGQRLDLLRAGTAAAMKSKDPTSAACLKCVRTCHNDQRRLGVLVSVLLGEKMIIPSGRALGDNMNGAFIIWDDLLRKLVRHQRHFLRVFVVQMVHLMIQQSRMNVKQDPSREALCLWALHIFIDESCADARKRIEDGLRTKVVSICIMNPVYWGQRLARPLIEAADETFQHDWIPLYNECLPQSASSSRRDSVAPVTEGSATQRELKRLDEVMFTPMKRPMVSSSAQRTGSSGAQLTSLRTPSNPAHPEESSQPWSLWDGGWRPVPIGLPPSWAEWLD